MAWLGGPLMVALAAAAALLAVLVNSKWDSVMSVRSILRHRYVGRPHGVTKQSSGKGK